MIRLAAVLMLACSICASDQLTDPVARAKEHAQHVQGKSEAKAYVELVHALVDDAGAKYTAQQYDDALKDLDEAHDALQHARSSAEQHKHDIKQCDLILDKVDRRLRDFKRAFAAQDRPKVEKLDNEVASVREKLLQILFETR